LLLLVAGLVVGHQHKDQVAVAVLEGSVLGQLCLLLVVSLMQLPLERVELALQR
jgi:hypothetical protein